MEILFDTFRPYIKKYYYINYYTGKIKNIEFEDACQDIHYYLWQCILKFQGDNINCFYKFCYNVIDYSFWHMITKTYRKSPKHGFQIISLNMKVHEDMELINTIKDKNDYFGEVLFEKMLRDNLSNKLPKNFENYIFELLDDNFCHRKFALKHNISYEYARKIKYKLRSKLIYENGELKLRN